MTPLPPSAEAAGLHAYEQVRAFEALQRRRLPLIYRGVALLMILGAGVIFRSGHVGMALLCFLVAVLFLGVALIHWGRLQAQYATNLRFVTDLETRYGEQLPWIQVERHFAALEKIQAELREEEAK